MSAMSLGDQTVTYNSKECKALKPLEEGRIEDVWN